MNAGYLRRRCRARRPLACYDMIRRARGAKLDWGKWGQDARETLVGRPPPAALRPVEGYVKPERLFQETSRGRKRAGARRRVPLKVNDADHVS
ncbi:hypothetical protein EVAR_76651_1 [Eumeta japonica]|uniref:Uncharacterized protein n=1 Tax=Eumeta variegata TaxID=151549 RepID=A0A4C1T587_EUMVA|nr:hypothetical protein EVAR_76651_1 [Eumeta japonica]